MIGGNRPNAHQRRGHGNIGFLRKLEQLGAGIGRNDTATAVQNRTLALFDQSGNFVDGDVADSLVGIVATGPGRPVEAI